MSNFEAIHILDMSNRAGYDTVAKMIDDFSCDKNPEIENFLHKNAWDFAKKRLASTYLVFTKTDNKYILVGYFSLTHKFFQVDETKLNAFSNTLKKRIDKFIIFNNELNRYMFSAPLIGQIGKNFHNNYNTMISGAELLNIACNTVDEALKIIGGKLVCIECENKKKLTDFYKQNGFNSFSRRSLEDDEKNEMSGDYLLQMLRYL